MQFETDLNFIMTYMLIYDLYYVATAYEICRSFGLLDTESLILIVGVQDHLFMRGIQIQQMMI